MPNDAYECPKVLLNVDKNAKNVLESDLCANVRFFALMNVSSHYWSLFHSNECLFSLDEQQKVYYINRGRTYHEAWRGRWRCFLHLFIYFSWLASVFNYHLMQIFLSYHWPRAPAPLALQMTALKWMPKNDGLLMRNVVQLCLAVWLSVWLQIIFCSRAKQTTLSPSCDRSCVKMAK